MNEIASFSIQGNTFYGNSKKEMPLVIEIIANFSVQCVETRSKVTDPA